MKVLGLLQNQWARNPTAMAAMFARCPHQRQRLIGQLLAQSVSGRRLRDIFGDWVTRIVWENASPVIAGNPSACPEPDVDHVNAALLSIRPDVVITFGVHAARVIRESHWLGISITAPHPAARMVDINQQLLVAWAELEGYAPAFAG